MKQPVNNLINRNGSAPLELVLVAPLLFFMFILVLWVGNFIIGQSYVVAEARNDAWHKRFTAADAEEYDFKGSEGYVEANATQERRISDLVSAFPNPRSRHKVMGDAWHARDGQGASAKAQQRLQELNSHWNAELSVKLAKNAGVNSVDQFLSGLASLKNIVGTIRNVIEQKIREQLDPLKDLLGDFKDQSDEYKKELEKQKEAERKKLQDRIEVIKSEIERVKGEIQAKKDRVKEIDEELKASEEAEDEEDKLSEDEVEALEDEKKRIEEEEIPALEKELLGLEKELELRQGLLDQLN